MVDHGSRPPVGSRLGRLAKPEKLIAVSVVSYWEVAIKANKRIFQIDDVVTWWARRVLPFSDLETLPIREEHVSELIRLPEIHKDPFDRVLVAQATVEGITLLTVDSLVAQYPGPIRMV